ALHKEAEERQERLRRDTEEEKERLRMETEVERVRVRSQLDGHREQLEAEKGRLQLALEDEKRRLWEKAEEDRKRLKEQVRRAIEEVMRRHAAELQGVCARLEEERRSGGEGRRGLEREREELRAQLQDATNEIRRLESIIKEQENKRRDPGEDPPTCRPQCSRLKEELQQAQSRLARVKEEGEKHRERQQKELGTLRADRHRLEEKFRIELNAAVAEGEQRCQGREEELQTQVAELQAQIAEAQSLQAEKKRAGLGEDCHGNPEIDRLRKEVQDTKDINKKLRDQLQRAELTQQHTEWSRQMTQRHMQQIEDLQAELHTHTQMMALQQDLKQQNQWQVFERQLDESGCLVLELQRENATLREQLKERSILEKSETEEKEKEKAETLRQRDAQLEEEAQRLKEEVEKLRVEMEKLEESQKHWEERKEEETKEEEEGLRRKEEHDRRRGEGERHQLQLHPPTVARDNKPHPGSSTPSMGRKHPEEAPPRLSSASPGASFDRLLFTPRSSSSSTTTTTTTSSSTLPHSSASHAHYSTSSLPHKHTPLSLGSQHPSSSPSLPRAGRVSSRASSSSCTPPTPAPTAPLPVCPSPPTGIRYVKSSSRDTRPHPPHGQPVRGSYLENRGSGTEVLKQEWYTKYFSF
ncbi:hypothetical protein CRUP_019228, partial [Coryphaenoides rupestris]